VNNIKKRKFTGLAKLITLTRNQLTILNSVTYYLVGRL